MLLLLSSAMDGTGDEPAPAIYRTLADINEIRLLELQPARDITDSIICRLVHRNFHDNPKYEALSYVWGSTDSPSRIEVNGSVVKVTRNLWHALKYLRLAGAPRVLWIDALCINQNDTTERNHQVSQMGKIYRNAWSVVAWLGRADKRTRVAMDYIIRFEPPEEEYIDKTGEIVRRPILIDGETIDAIVAFCSRQYWTRLWIIQEVLVASQVIIQCGSVAYNWNRFSLFLRTAKVHAVIRCNNGAVPRLRGRKPDEQFSRLLKSHPMSLCRNREIVQNGLPLDYLCKEFSSSECTDRLDKIFGLLALARDCCRQAVPVDYSSSIAELYLRLIFHSHQRHRPLGVDFTRYCEDLHRVLGVSAQDLERANLSYKLLDAETGIQIKDETINFSGYVQGRIFFISGPLGRNGYEKEVRIPRMAFPTFIQPHFLHCADSKRWRGDLSQAYRLRAALSLHAQGTTVWRIPARTPKSIVWARRKYRYWKSSLLGLGSSDIFRQVLQIARATAIKSGMRDCQLAIDDTGRIFYAPTEAGLGDLVLQRSLARELFDSQGLIIARATGKVASSYELVGRGLNFFEALSAREAGGIKCACPELTSPRAIGGIDFKISFGTFQRLVVPSDDASLPGTGVNE
jgi:hypothetical protein